MPSLALSLSLPTLRSSLHSKWPAACIISYPLSSSLLALHLHLPLQEFPFASAFFSSWVISLSGFDGAPLLLAAGAARRREQEAGRRPPPAALQRPALAWVPV